MTLKPQTGAYTFPDAVLFMCRFVYVPFSSLKIVGDAQAIRKNCFRRPGPTRRAPAAGCSLRAQRRWGPTRFASSRPASSRGRRGGCARPRRGRKRSSRPRLASSRGRRGGCARPWRGRRRSTRRAGKNEKALGLPRAPRGGRPPGLTRRLYGCPAWAPVPTGTVALGRGHCGIKMGSSFALKKGAHCPAKSLIVGRSRRGT